VLRAYFLFVSILADSLSDESRLKAKGQEFLKTGMMMPR
jgi:hypothetical protein